MIKKTLLLAALTSACLAPGNSGLPAQEKALVGEKFLLRPIKLLLQLF